jgi:hypothetical protein
MSVCTANGALSFFTLAVYQGYLEEFKKRSGAPTARRHLPENVG